MWFHCWPAGGSSSSVFTQQLRVSLVLQFMENLEKLLYNAYEGCVVAMPASIKVRGQIGYMIVIPKGLFKSREAAKINYC